MAGRVIAGIGLGMITSSVSVLQSETAPARIRGRLIAMSLSSLLVGQLLAYWLDYGMNAYTTDISWRFPLSFQAVIALIMSGLLLFMPECKSNIRSLARKALTFSAPRWLCQRGREAEALKVIMRLRNKDRDDPAVILEVAEIQAAIELDRHQSGWRDLVRKDAVQTRTRVALACMVMSMNPFSGSTAISYYTTVM